MRRISPLERLRLFGRAGIDVVATLGRSVLFLLGALFGRSRAGKPLKLNPIGLKILALLMQKSPHVVRREVLEEANKVTRQTVPAFSPSVTSIRSPSTISLTAPRRWRRFLCAMAMILSASPPR